LLLLCVPGLAQSSPFPPNSAVNIGFSTRVLAGMNRADVIAGLQAWVLALTREQHLSFRADCRIFETTADIEKAIQGGQIDVITAATDDFVVLEKAVPLNGYFTSTYSGKITEDYVLVVDRDQAARDLKDLRGHDLLLLDHHRMTLAPLWLDTELLRRKLPTSARFFGKITHVTKPDQAILPVFFRRSAAALVTRAQFNTAAELNPQLAKQLRILAFSPPLIPAIGALRGNTISGAGAFYRKEALRTNKSVGGRQILNLFQSDGVVEVKATDLAETRALLAEYTRLKPRGANH
jgi:ABC-type phosphate/phosphonate transport system substrate-binding protein